MNEFHRLLILPAGQFELGLEQEGVGLILVELEGAVEIIKGVDGVAIMQFLHRLVVENAVHQTLARA